MAAPSSDKALADEPIRISSREILRAVFGWKVLTSELKGELKQVVDNSSGWIHGVPIILGLLKASAHQGVGFPTSPFTVGFNFRAGALSAAGRLVESYPKLEGLVNSVAWRLCLNPKSAGNALRWLAREAPWLENMARSRQIPIFSNLVLLFLALDTDDRVRHQPLLRSLGSPFAFKTPTHGRRHVSEWLRLLTSAEILQLPKGPGGTILRLAVEHDPLQMLHMGGYFNTCLSPGGANFYSTVAVAIDVNKQVLFMRDSKRNVVGKIDMDIVSFGAARHCTASNPSVVFQEFPERFVSLVPLPNVAYPDERGWDEGGWTEEMVGGILCNPVYAGIPPFPAMIDDQTWISAGVKLVEEVGLRQYLVNVLYELKKSLGSVCTE